MKLRIIVTIYLLLLSSCSHKHNIKHNIDSNFHNIEKESNSIIGVAAINLESGKTIRYHAYDQFQMASTVKVPIAIYLMHLAQNNQINLDKMIVIEPGDLVMGSGLMGYFLSKPGLSISIYNMFEPMIAISDNSATDIILKEIGGPSAVYKYLQKNDLQDIKITRSIEQLYADSSGLTAWPKRTTLKLSDRVKIIKNIPDEIKIKAYEKFYVDSRDTATPIDMELLMMKLYNKKLLNDKYTKILMDVLNKDSFSRVRSTLPKGSTLASKTGTWWDNSSSGKKYNYMGEVGIISLPKDTGHIVFAIYIKSDQSNLEKQKKAMKDIAKLILLAMEAK